MSLIRIDGCLCRGSRFGRASTAAGREQYNGTGRRERRNREAERVRVLHGKSPVRLKECALFQAATFHLSIAYRNWFLEIVKKLHLFLAYRLSFVVNSQQFESQDAFIPVVLSESLSKCSAENVGLRMQWRPDAWPVRQPCGLVEKGLPAYCCACTVGSLDLENRNPEDGKFRIRLV